MSLDTPDFTEKEIRLDDKAYVNRMTAIDVDYDPVQGKVSFTIIELYLYYTI